MPKNYDSGATPHHRVWEFRNESASWITWSVGFDSPTPAAGSAAAAWSTLTVCYDLAPSVMLTKPAAIAVAKLLRAIRRREGQTILHDRSWTLPGPASPVGGCRSIRELSRRLGVSFRRARAIYADSAGFDDCGGDATGKIGTTRPR